MEQKPYTIADAQTLCNKIMQIQEQIDAAKGLYELLDEAVLSLHAMVGTETAIHVGPGPDDFMKLSDNFAVKNTVWRASSIRRFEAVRVNADGTLQKTKRK